MTRVAQVRVRVAVDPDGWRRVQVGCPCATVCRTLSPAGILEDAVLELVVEHRATALVCRHPLGLAVPLEVREAVDIRRRFMTGSSMGGGRRG